MFMEIKEEQVELEAEKRECPNCGREMVVIEGTESCVCGAEGTAESGCGCGGACGCGGHH